VKVTYDPFKKLFAPLICVPRRRIRNAVSFCAMLLLYLSFQGPRKVLKYLQQRLEAAEYAVRRPCGVGCCFP